METLSKIWAWLGTAWSFVDGFVEEHPRWAMAIFVVVLVGSHWLR